VQRAILDVLREGERSLEEIHARLAEAPARVLSALSMLELAGAIEARPGQRYVLR
jgi:predicted Rossmann fold nucleotide-binding protein DprA/Smf involved in DNA uptake